MFANNNKNSLPDVFEDMNSLQGMISNVMSSTKIVVNEQTYDSIDQLPPEIRAKYEKAMGKLDAKHDGVPYLFERMIKTTAQVPHCPSTTLKITRSLPAQPLNLNQRPGG